MAKKHRQADHRADTRGGALSGLPHAVSDSAAYLDLGPFDRCVLAEILRRFNGYNNGEIVISYEELGERLRCGNTCRPNNGRLGRSIANLIDHGFLGEPTPGSWLQRQARQYRITFITSGKAPPYKAATNDYRLWSPTQAKNVGNAASPETTQSGDARSPEPISAGDARSPELLKNGSFALVGDCSSGYAESPLICKPYGGHEYEGIGWWNANRAISPSAAFVGVLVAARPTERPKRKAMRKPRSCERCGSPFETLGTLKRYCGETCRKRSERQRARCRETPEQRDARLIELRHGYARETAGREWQTA